jgi:hypothetical protein
MDDSPECCALCARPLPLERYDVFDLDGLKHVCAECLRQAELDAELEDALHGV